MQIWTLPFKQSFQLRRSDVEQASSLLRGMLEDVSEHGHVVLHLDGLSSTGLGLFMGVMQNPGGEEEFGARVFAQLDQNEQVTLYSAFDKYDMQLGLRAMEGQLRRMLVNYHVSPSRLLSAYRWNLRLIGIVCALAEDAFVPYHPDSKALQLIIDRKQLPGGLKCALMLGGPRTMLMEGMGEEGRVAYGRFNLIVRIPDEGEDDSYMPGGTTGFWLRKYCDRKRKLGWLHRRDGDLVDCPESEASRMKWLVVALPGMWNGDDEEGLGVVPSNPAEWISEDFNPDYYDHDDHDDDDDDDGGDDHDDDDHDQAERVIVFPELEDALVLAAQTPTLLIINCDGTVIHRAPEVQHGDLQQCIVT